jgi:hypothetical protein
MNNNNNNLKLIIKYLLKYINKVLIIIMNMFINKIIKNNTIFRLIKSAKIRILRKKKMIVIAKMY